MGNNDPGIRKAQPADTPKMKNCVKAAYRHYIARMGKPPGPMLDDYSEVVRKHQAFVAELNGQVVGVLVLILQDEGILLDNFAVPPEYQGQGFGRKLVEFAESEARNQEFSHLDLYTHECMAENIKMYKRLGYVNTERRTVRGYQRVYMRKSLPKLAD
ncbi:MAG: GNAT family N-acetyltransferase [Acidiferrobacterales bacterium]|jgi:ribosomal protein S18 acetylase RimI-like enzyme